MAAFFPTRLILGACIALSAASCRAPRAAPLVQPTCAMPELAPGAPVPWCALSERPVLDSMSLQIRYPTILRDAGHDGSARFSIVVDKTGRVAAAGRRDLSATHMLVAAALRRALDSLRFAPGRLRGAPVDVAMTIEYSYRTAYKRDTPVRVLNDIIATATGIQIIDGTETIPRNHSLPLFSEIERHAIYRAAIRTLIREVVADSGRRVCVELAIWDGGPGGSERLEPPAALIAGLTDPPILPRKGCPRSYSSWIGVLDSLGRTLESQRPPGYRDPWHLSLWSVTPWHRLRAFTHVEMTADSQTHVYTCSASRSRMAREGWSAECWKTGSYIH